MEEIRKVSRAYFDGQNQDDRRLAWRFFESLDANGDGKVSLEEYKRHVDSSFSSDHVFELLDANGDGTLEFEEVLTLYYMDNVSMPRCSACGVMLLSSSYFSCLPCLGKTSYHLCCDCYGGGRCDHHHPSGEFADTRALLKHMDRLMTKLEVDIVDQPDAPTDQVQKGASVSKTKPNQSSPTPTKSTTEIVIKKLAIFGGRAIIIKGVTTVAVVLGCCIM